MNDSEEIVSRWKALIDSYVASRRREETDSSDPVLDKEPLPLFSEIIQQAPELRDSVDAAALRLLLDALEDDLAMWFVVSLYGDTIDVDRSESGVRRYFLKGDPPPEELFEPMMRAALKTSYLSADATRYHTFAQGISMWFGYRRCAEFMIPYCDAAEIGDVPGIINVAGAISPMRWIEDPENPPSETGGIRVLVRDFDGEGLFDIRDELVKALVRCYIRFDDASVRSGLGWILGFEPSKKRGDRDLLLETATSMGIDSADPRLADILNHS